jgi:hypothetical protein
LTLYKGGITIRSVRNDRDYGRNLQTLPFSFDTPDYTALSATLTQPKAHLIQNIVAEINLNSKAVHTSPAWMNNGNYPVLALALDISGGSGTALGDIDCGTSIDVQTITVNGTSYTTSFVATQDFVETVRQWLLLSGSPVTNATTIEVVNTATAGTGGTPAIDAFVVVGLDNEVALAYDDIYSTKAKINLELSEGFQIEPLFTKTILSDAFDGYGQGRKWKIRYDSRAFGQRNLQLAGFTDNVIDLPLKNLDVTKNYNAHIIDVYDDEETLTVTPMSQKRVIFLLEAPCTCAPAGDFEAFDLSSSSDTDTYEFNGVTYEDDSSSDGVTGGNTAFNGTAAGLAAAIESDNAGVRAIVSGDTVTVEPCNTNQLTTAAALDSVLAVWLKACPNLNSVNVLSAEFGTDYFTPA